MACLLTQAQEHLRGVRDAERERLKQIQAEAKGVSTFAFMVQLQRYHLADDASLAMDRYVTTLRQAEALEHG